MTNLQKIQLRQSENRSAITKILDTPESERSDGWQTELDKLTTRAQNIEAELRAALVLESEPEQTTTETTPEQTEIDKLMGRVTISEFIGAALDGAALDGAGAELRAELGLGPEQFPIDLLETRADAATSIADAPEDRQRSGIMERVFAGSSGDYIGVQRPTVPVGDSVYVTMTAGAAADVRSPGVTKDAEAASFTTKTISPVRVTARYVVDVESTAKLAGLENTLRADLGRALADKLDAAALNGQAAVSNVSPAIEGLINTLPDPTDPTEVATWEEYLGLYADRIDGKYSVDGSNVRVLVDPMAYKQAHALQIATSGELLIDKLPGSRFRASANMPDPASNIAKVLSYTAGRRGVVQPVWRAASIIRDPYTKAAEGQIALTIIALAGLALVDANPYKLHELKLA